MASLPRVGWIGAGRMGVPMAVNPAHELGLKRQVVSRTAMLSSSKVDTALGHFSCCRRPKSTGVATEMNRDSQVIPPLRRRTPSVNR